MFGKGVNTLHGWLTHQSDHSVYYKHSRVGKVKQSELVFHKSMSLRASVFTSMLKPDLVRPTTVP